MRRDVRRWVPPAGPDGAGPKGAARAALGTPGRPQDGVAPAREAATAPFDRGPRPPAAGTGAGRCPPPSSRLDTPVVLVHGYGAATSSWLVVRRSLRAAGFACVRTMEYRPLGADVPTLARRLVAQVRALLAETGAERVHLVGHSLGGVVIRYAVCVLGLDAATGTAITVASPHGGSHLARAGLGRIALQLRPGSALLRQIEAAARPGAARWVAYGAGADVVVPAPRAAIRPAVLRATNAVVPDEGHLSVLASPRLAAAIVAQLARSEEVAQGGSAHRSRPETSPKHGRPDPRRRVGPRGVRRRRAAGPLLAERP